MHTQKRRKKSERGVTDTDHSQNVFKLKKEGAVWRRLVMPQSSPVKPEDKCNVLSAQCLAIKKLVPALREGKEKGNKMVNAATQCFEQKKY